MSKIKEIKGCKAWEGVHGTVYYHALIMEDGKKLNIGKKKENAFQVGQDIDVEISSEPDQNGWQKAKHITMNKKTGWVKEPFEEKASGFALRYAVDMAIARDWDATQTLTTATLFNKWLRENSKP